MEVAMAYETAIAVLAATNLVLLTIAWWQERRIRALEGYLDFSKYIGDGEGS
jgi:hypothetical protein